jgi:hypothetical protein
MRWNWQLPDWPDFQYDASRIRAAEERFLKGAGVVVGSLHHLDSDARLGFTIELISQEMVDSSAIEGEVLDRASVQSSLARQLGFASDIRHGVTCPLVSTPLGTDLAAAIAKANNLNEAFKEWRTGKGGNVLVKGTVAWLFAWYREQDRFKKNAHKTKVDYRKLMDALCAFETKKGQPPLGKRMAAKVDATVADNLYRKLRDRGERQATYAMQVCRLVWTWAVRHHRTTGVTENPFNGMGLKSTAAKGNRYTSRAEYTLYRETARAMGYQSMATAAALGFECCQRTWDVFGFVDPEGKRSRGILWSGYRPGEEITLIQGKTGNPVTLPLYVDVPGEAGEVERVLLYPELEEELARWRALTPAPDDVIVVEDAGMRQRYKAAEGQRYSERRMSTVHRAICEKAGLPKNMTFTGFRHGGLTEIGDAGEADPRAVSGHKTLAVTAIYNKASEEKARQIAIARREHIAMLEEQKADAS